MSESDNGNGGSNSQKRNISVNVFGRTDVGLVRDHNEDNFLVADLTTKNRSIKPEVRNHDVGEMGSLFIVCDGMGGAAAGEVASQVGVDTIYEMMVDCDPPVDDEDLAYRLDAAISEAGKRIFTAARLDRKRRGMGTTVTAAVMAGPRLVLGQVGDSRAYIVRDGELTQVTKDQSLVQQLLDANQLTEEEARNFDKANIILQALGTAEEVHVDVTSTVLNSGDVLVMCSDGLSGVAEESDILAIINEFDKEIDTMEACRKLTDLACQGGGSDNITVIVAQFDGVGLAALTEGISPRYSQFEFTTDTEITVSKQNPLKVPALEEKDVEEPDDDLPNPSGFDFDEEETQVMPKAMSEPVQPVQRQNRVRTGLFAGVIAALLVGGALVAYTISLRRGAADSAAEDEIATVNETQGAVSLTPKATPTMPVDSAPNASEKPSEPEEEPKLPPTEPSAIVGRDTAAQQKTTSIEEKSPPSEVAGREVPGPDKMIGVEDKPARGSGPDVTSKAAPEAAPEAAPTVDSATPKAKMPRTAGKTAKKKPADSAKKEKKKAKKAEPKPPKKKVQKKDAFAPKRLDDNPF